jgi:hypothetical protein
MRRGPFAFAAIIVLVIAGVAHGQVSGPDPVKTGTVNEHNPAASATWFAWTKVSVAHPNRANVFAEPMPLNDGDAFRVNPSGTRAFTGGIDGNTLAYQRVKRGHSNIRLFDLVTKSDTASPINTRQWEWHPSISTDISGNLDQWILFGRQLRNGVDKVLVHNMTTDETRTLGRVDRPRYGAEPGQVNGDWATWTICKARCNVWYIDLTDPLATPTKIPKPTAVHQYGSSVTPDGTIYYVESGSGCGVNVKIDKWDGVTATPVTSLSSGRDINFTSTSAEADGNHFYFDRVVCSTDRWNIYQVVDAG